GDHLDACEIGLAPIETQTSALSIVAGSEQHQTLDHFQQVLVDWHLAQAWTVPHSRHRHDGIASLSTNGRFGASLNDSHFGACKTQTNRTRQHPPQAPLSRSDLVLGQNYSCPQRTQRSISRRRNTSELRTITQSNSIARLMAPRFRAVPTTFSPKTG
ncbi:MAG: hypothetical protein ACI9TZ_003273, partial [Yoonia sp.]